MKYKIALALFKRSDHKLVRHLEASGISPEDFFRLSERELLDSLGLHVIEGFSAMERDEAVFAAERELNLIEKHKIKPYFLSDSDYPFRLSQIPDPPVMLFKLGEMDLNATKSLSIVGTRHATPYGVNFCNRLLSELSPYYPDLNIISGLAHGIDAAAHSAALENNLPTAAVVAHGLNMIYPANHRDLARKIIANGGCIITEYPFKAAPYRQRFLERNRIIAALSDVTAVVESDIKGGALSTAAFAFSYSREVMAVPGRVTDKASSGCNNLIRTHKASILTSGADITEVIGWKPLGLPIDTSQRNLFPELDGEMKTVYDILSRETDPVQADAITLRSSIPTGKLMGILTEMEFEGIIFRHPGNRFSIS